MNEIKYLFDSPLFYKSIFSEQLTEIDTAVRKNLAEMLLKQLNDEEQNILLHESFWQADPNGYTPGGGTSLINRLLVEAGVSVSRGFKTSTIRNNKFKGRSIYVYNARELCGVSMEELEILIQSINNKWGEFVEIEIEIDDNSKRHLHFQLHT